MLTMKSILILLYFITIVCVSFEQEIHISINPRKPLHIVDDKFISFSVNSTALIGSLNKSSSSVNLLKYLSPAFIRFSAASSTSQNSEVNNDETPTNRSLFLNPSTWTLLNDWLISSNLTPVWPLNDRDRINDAWNPDRTVLPLMEMANRTNLTCYWELVNAMPNKTPLQHLDDLLTLRNIIRAFPEKQKSWKTVTGKITEESNRLTLRIFKHGDVVIHEMKNADDKILPSTKFNHIQLLEQKQIHSNWILLPKNKNPISFRDSLLWAKNLGETAVMGYDAIFRQLDNQELFEVTPSYWISMLYKKLMSKIVLDARRNYKNKHCYIYAHCSKMQNIYPNKESVTLMAVNMEQEISNISVKFVGTFLRNAEVQSYIFTSPNEDSSEIYLNGELLTVSNLNAHKTELMPKLQHIQGIGPVQLSLPGKSIGFFVVPSVRFGSCFNLIHEGTQSERKLSLHRYISDSSDSISDVTSHIQMQNASNKKNQRRKRHEPEANVSFHSTDGNKIFKQKMKSEIQIPKRNECINCSNRNFNVVITPEEVNRILQERSKVKSTQSSKIPNRKRRQSKKEDYDSETTDYLDNKMIFHVMDNEIRKNMKSDSSNEVQSSHDLPTLKKMVENFHSDMQMFIKSMKSTADDLKKSLTVTSLSRTNSDLSNTSNKSSDMKLEMSQEVNDRLIHKMKQIIQQIKSETKVSNESKEKVTFQIPEDVKPSRNRRVRRTPTIDTNAEIKAKNEPKNDDHSRFRSITNRPAINNLLTKHPTTQTTFRENIIKENSQNLVQESDKSTANDIVLPSAHNNAVLKMLHRKLTHQKKIEEKLSNYLQKVRQSASHIAEEIKKTSFASENMVKGSGEFSKKNIEKRDVSGYSSDEENSSEAKALKNSLADKTKENEIFTNEIPKEGKSLSNYEKEKDASVYLSKKLKHNTEEESKENDNLLTNNISKEGKWLSAHEKEIEPNIYLTKLKQGSAELDEIKKVLGEINTTRNIKVPFLEQPGPSSYNLFTSAIQHAYNVSKTKQSKSSLNAIPEQESDNKSSTEYMDTTSSTIPVETSTIPVTDTSLNNEEGFVDQVFHTLADFLKDFHSKVVDYLHFLTH